MKDKVRTHARAKLGRKSLFRKFFFILYPSSFILFLLLSACGEVATPVPASSPAAPATPFPTLANQPPVKVAVGGTAPDFSASDLNGQPVQLSAYRGKAVVVNFWAVYCDFCREELPAFVKTYEANKDKMAIIGVDINDDLGDVKDFIRQFKMTYQITIDDTGDLIYKYRVPAHPTSVFINKYGVITGIVAGLTTPQRLDEELAKAYK
jgi:peroxiredoxin